MQAQTWIIANQNEILNIGENQVVLPVFHPHTPFELCYQIELAQHLYEKYKNDLTELNAEIYDSAEAYVEHFYPANEQ